MNIEEKICLCPLANQYRSFLRRQLRGKAWFRAPTYKCPEALDGCRVVTGEGQAQQHFQEGCQVGLGLPEPGALGHL